MVRILTLFELYERLGGEAAVDALVSGAQDVQSAKSQALTDAELEASRNLSRRYELPADPSTAPEDLKSLIARSFPYHARRAVAPREDLTHEAELHERDVLDVYRAAATRKIDIPGLIERRPARPTAGTGKAVKPRPERRPVDAGAMDGLRRLALGCPRD